MRDRTATSAGRPGRAALRVAVLLTVGLLGGCIEYFAEPPDLAPTPDAAAAPEVGFDPAPQPDEGAPADAGIPPDQGPIDEGVPDGAPPDVITCASVVGCEAGQVCADSACARPRWSTLESGSAREPALNFGYAVAAHADLVAVAASGDRAVYLYRAEADGWRLLERLVPAHACEDGFGNAMDFDGETLVIGAQYRGANRGEDCVGGIGSAGGVYVFERQEDGSFVENETLRRERTALQAGEPERLGYLGTSVTVSGDRIAAGAPGSNAVYVFERAQAGEDWSEAGILRVDDMDDGGSFGRSVAADGQRLAVGASTALGPLQQEGMTGKGRAFVFDRTPDGWVESELTFAQAVGNQQYGGAVAVDGDTVAVSAWLADGNRGAVHLFRHDADRGWFRQSPLTAAATADENDYFGTALALSGGRLVVGAPREDGDAASTFAAPNDAAELAGVAYVFERRDTDDWELMGYLKPDPARSLDLAGWGVALAGERVVVAAPATEEGEDDPRPAGAPGRVHVVDFDPVLAGEGE